MRSDPARSRCESSFVFVKEVDCLPSWLIYNVVCYFYAKQQPLACLRKFESAEYIISGTLFPNFVLLSLLFVFGLKEI